jgi:glycosyltransferase involved in cell wall biosynthesis
VRVALWVYGDLGQPTGGYVYDRIVVDGLRAAGDDVHVLDPRTREPPPNDVDVVIGDALCAPELGALFAGAPSAATTVLLVHHMPSWEVERTDREACRAVEVSAVGAASEIIATSEATARRLALEYPGRQAVVVPPGADRLPRVGPAPQADGEGCLRLLFVGSLVPRKRLPLLLDAVERLGGGSWRLEVIGDPGRDLAHASDLRSRVEGSAILRPRVLFRGVVHDTELAIALGAADALILPSSLEGYGIVLGEALAAGLPVIVSRAVADAAQLATDDAALVFGDDAALFDVLRRLSAGPALAVAKSRAAATGPPRTWNAAVASFRRALTRAAEATRARPPGRGFAPR